MGVIAVFAAFNAVASHYELVQSAPRAFYEIGLIVVVALAFVPSTIAAVVDVREADRARTGGRVVRRGRLLRQLVPVLESGLERAVNLAESMDSRGFAHGGAAPGNAPRAGSAPRRCSRSPARSSRSSARATEVAAGLGLAGLVGVVAAIRLASTGETRGRYRPRHLTRADRLVCGAAIATPVALGHPLARGRRQPVVGGEPAALAVVARAPRRRARRAARAAAPPARARAGDGRRGGAGTSGSGDAGRDDHGRDRQNRDESLSAIEYRGVSYAYPDAPAPRCATSSSTSRRARSCSSSGNRVRARARCCAPRTGSSPTRAAGASPARSSRSGGAPARTSPASSPTSSGSCPRIPRPSSSSTASRTTSRSCSRTSPSPKRRCAAGSRRCSTRSASPTCAAGARRRSRAANGSAPRSPARSRPRRPRWCSTNRRRSSTPRVPTTCSPPSPASTPISAPRSCSPSTAWSGPRRSPTARCSSARVTPAVPAAVGDVLGGYRGAPSVTRLGRLLGWDPPPLTVRAAARSRSTPPATPGSPTRRRLRPPTRPRASCWSRHAASPSPSAGGPSCTRRWRCTTARWSRCSAATARGRRRCCARSGT